MRRHVFLMLVALLLAACTSGGGATASPASPSAPASAPGSPDSPAPSEVSGPTIDEIKSAGKLVCGVKFDVIAFGFRNPTSGEVEGFDADLCREIAAALGVEPEFVEAISANRIPFLQEDRVDIVISTMTRTEDRLKEIDFSKIYYLAGQRILVKSDSPYQEVEDLVEAGVTVCSGQGSTSEANLREKGVAEDKLLLTATYSEAAQALLDGRCDAVSTDDSILFGLAQQNEGLEVRGERFTEEPLGIGIKKGKEDLVEFINGVLDDMAASGRWAELYDTHVKPYTGEEAPEPPLDL
ncbi:MAG TPA: glutamate ABC transporter substrate-binding protein [Candidatus Limnocylindrales bacterium]|nr:glutamate ABC transporter substrate-binding protein [Candidatus Limnocylindrales bacterium]